MYIRRTQAFILNHTALPPSPLSLSSDSISSCEFLFLANFWAFTNRLFRASNRKRALPNSVDSRSQSATTSLSTTTMSPHSSEALYHPIPQAPVAATPVVLPDIDQESLDEATIASDLAPYYSFHCQPNRLLTGRLSEVTVNTRIRWIHFVLGCAVLLPWNGTRTSASFPTCCTELEPSNDYGHAVLLIASRELSPPTSV